MTSETDLFWTSVRVSHPFMRKRQKKKNWATDTRGEWWENSSCTRTDPLKHICISSVLNDLNNSSLEWLETLYFKQAPPSRRKTPAEEARGIESTTERERIQKELSDVDTSSVSWHGKRWSLTSTSAALYSRRDDDGRRAGNTGFIIFRIIPQRTNDLWRIRHAKLFKNIQSQHVSSGLLT